MAVLALGVASPSPRDPSEAGLGEFAIVIHHQDIEDPPWYPWLQDGPSRNVREFVPAHGADSSRRVGRVLGFGNRAAPAAGKPFFHRRGFQEWSSPRSSDGGW